MRAKPRVAVVGFGAIGRHHARNLAEMPGIAFTGVVDVSEYARDEAARMGYRVFDSIDSALALGLDSAVVSVPTSSHFETASQLADAHVALLVEKPIASTLEEGRAIIAACRRSGVPLMVGYVERFNPAIITAHRLLLDGLVGTPLHVATRRVGTMPPRIKDANVIVDIGVHDIDIVSFLLDSKLRLISAQGGMALIDDRVDYASLALDAGGVAAHATVNWLTPVKVRDLTITGSKGYLQIDYLSQTAFFAPGRDFVPTSSYEVLIAQYEQGTLLECPVVKREPLRVQLERFVEVLGGAEAPNPEIALESLRIALEATEMIESNIRVNAHR
ncbi:MAG: Gfo/Idh/MocA family oxidoreductase [Candidatus Eremiobacteraeota bacterium]|nr:Gfo/Idh/MocA family oxidoreductase [Candidatus Eremiobacteraeota bacterium]